MYIARFSFDVLPINRQEAIDFIHREVAAATGQALKARLLIPVTRAHESASLQFEVELERLDQLEQFRDKGIGSADKTASWMKEFSAILRSPPTVELLRIVTS